MGHALEPTGCVVLLARTSSTSCGGRLASGSPEQSPWGYGLERAGGVVCLACSCCTRWVVRLARVPLCRPGSVGIIWEIVSRFGVPPVRAAEVALPAGPQSNLQECAETLVEGYPGYEVM